MPITENKTDLFISKIVKRDGDLKDRSVFERHLAFDITSAGYDQNVVIEIKSDTTIDVDALQINIQGQIEASLNVTINCAGTGANGIDTGALGASTWYYVFAIYDTTNSAAAGLLSASSTTPTMPANYVLKRLIGYVETDADSDLLVSMQFMNHFMRDFYPEIVSTPGTNATWSGAIATGVPSGIRIGIFGVYGYKQSDGAIIVLRAHGHTGNTENQDGLSNAYNTAAAHAGYMGGEITCDMDSSQQINYRHTVHSGAGNLTGFKIVVKGFICGLF